MDISTPITKTKCTWPDENAQAFLLLVIKFKVIDQIDKANQRNQHIYEKLVDELAKQGIEYEW